PFGLAAAHQHRFGCLARSRLVQPRLAADQGVVEPAMILALELHISLPPGMGAGKADRGMGGFRARDREAHALAARLYLLDPLGQADLPLMLPGDALPVGERGGDSPDHGGRGMAEHGRSVAEDVVDQDVAVDVVEPWPLAAAEEQRRRRLAIAHIAVD